LHQHQQQQPVGWFVTKLSSSLGFFDFPTHFSWKMIKAAPLAVVVEGMLLQFLCNSSAEFWHFPICSLELTSLIRTVCLCRSADGAIENYGFLWIRVRPRILVDVSSVDTSTTVLGFRISMPIMVAPTALHKFAHPEGEVATARAISAADTIMILSSSSNCTMEEVAAAGPGVRFFQLYVSWTSPVIKNCPQFVLAVQKCKEDGTSV
jgi:hypothetical protein